MIKKRIIIIFIMALFLLTFVVVVTPAQNDLHYKLQELVDAELTAYKEKVPDYPGGLAIGRVKEGQVLKYNKSYIIFAACPSHYG